MEFLKVPKKRFYYVIDKKGWHHAKMSLLRTGSESCTVTNYYDDIGENIARSFTNYSNGKRNSYHLAII